MPEITPNGTKIYHTRDKQYEVESGLLQVFFNALEGINNIVVNSEKGYADPRIDMMVIYLFSFALNEEEYEDLCERREQEIMEALDKYQGSSKKQEYAKYNANMKAVVRATKLFDRFMGYRTKQEIMRIAPPELDKEMKEKFPDVESKWACKT